MRLDAPAAKTELALLQVTKVGDKRDSPLLPALDADVVWTCVRASETVWEFEGTFLGLPLFKATMTVLPETMTLDVREM